jgi:pentatricopeptide repeat protein
MLGFAVLVFYFISVHSKKAEEEYIKALAINPMEPMAHNNLGLIYMDEGRLDETEMEYKKEIEINPIYDAVYFNYGLLFYKEGKKDEAINAWNQTIKINPEYSAAYNNLVLVYLEQEKYNEAKYVVQQMQIRGFQISPQLLEQVNDSKSGLKFRN